MSYGQPPPQGYGQGYGPPPKKGLGTGMILLIVLGLLFGGCVLTCGVLGAIGSRSTSTAATTDPVGSTTTPSPRGARGTPVAPVNAFPWVEEINSNCSAYKAAPNEIKKSAIFRANKELIERTTVNNARGKLTGMRTNQGGSELTLMIKADGVEFHTESVFAAIKQGTPVYEAASEMKIGDCVTFSVRKLKSSSMVERSQVCDLEYFADFSALGPCH